MSAFHDGLQLTQQVGPPGGTARALFVARVIEGALAHVRSGGWATSARSLDSITDALHRVSGEGSHQVLTERDGTLLQLDLFSGWVQVRVAGNDLELVSRVLAELKELFPPPDPSSSHKVNVQFWTYGQHGPISSYREVSVPEWGDLEGNYTTATRAGLDELMRNFTPAHGGQLILWHGEAGTGNEFVPLGTDEANAWLERNGSAERVQRPTLLGDLYAMQAGQPPGTLPPTGFAS